MTSIHRLARSPRFWPSVNREAASRQVLFLLFTSSPIYIGTTKDIASSLRAYLTKIPAYDSKYLQVLLTLADK